jgi:hypothetical protein
MQYYRNINLIEAFKVFENNMALEPKSFKANLDSDAKTGKLSFWFDCESWFSSSDIMVISEDKSIKYVGKMTAGRKDYNGEMVPYAADEFATKKTVGVRFFKRGYEYSEDDINRFSFDLMEQEINGIDFAHDPCFDDDVKARINNFFSYIGALPERKIGDGVDALKEISWDELYKIKDRRGKGGENE